MVERGAGCGGADCSGLTREELLASLDTTEQGLTADQAAERLKRHGPNQIREIKGRPLIFKFLENFYHLFAIMLWVGGGLAFVGEMPQLGWAIFAVILINAVFSFWQEFRAEKATEALKRLMPRSAKVIRDGRLQQVDATVLVPGDIIVLEEGDAISADARLIEEFELRVSMATLNGESEPVRKTAGSHADDSLTEIEMPNLVFAGTSVAYGSGKAVVFATAMGTQFGRIAELTQSVEAELSPLQKEMGKVTQLVAILATVLGVLFFFLGYYVAGLTLIEGFVFAVGIIVANVPEGLLPTVSLALAMGVQRMAKRHALIKKLSSVETLGCTTVICTDKTGTLTKNEMTVTDLWFADRRIKVNGGGYEPAGSFEFEGKTLADTELQAMDRLFRVAAMCNNSRLIEPEADGGWSVLGDPTEAALLVAARKAGFDEERELGTARRVFELPFDSVRKRMTTIHLRGSQREGYVKGAPKEVLELCERVIGPEGEVSLDSAMRARIIDQNDEFARDGLRVLAMAYRPIDRSETEYRPDITERGLVFVGLMAMMDPPREEVAQAVEECATAGIRVIMITGDYGLTAESIARRIGIIKGSQARIITGLELNEMNDQALAGELAHDNVLFARVSPEHKMRIAATLKSMDHIVAMTGDGVNDAPALKVADIGVAMGIAGTDVAKEAADMILTDDNFASIVSAIEEGRAVYDNIRRFVTYIFTSNIPEIVPFLLMVIFRIPLALTVMQILAIDLGTDMIPALALGTEKPEPGIMNRPPRPRNERLLNKKVLTRAYLFLGPIQTAACMFAFFYMYWISGWRPGMAMATTGAVYVLATTMTHAAVVTTQIGNGFAQRTNRESIFKVGFFSNRFLIWGIVIELVVINILIYVEPFQSIFEHGPISGMDWVVLLALAPVLLVADEIRKFFLRRREPLAQTQAAIGERSSVSTSTRAAVATMTERKM